MLSPTQITASLLVHLRDCASKELATKLVDCVVSVPVYYNDEQRHAMLDACKIAGLNCLRLFNETAAVALAYGIYKQDLPAEGEKPRRVVFVDVGHSATQLCCAEFVKGKLSVLATEHELVGGRDFDIVIRDKMIAEFKEKTGLDVNTSARASIRLEQESEKLKKLMSANQTNIPLNIECLMEDTDFSSHMLRADFEELCAAQFERISSVVRRFMATLSAKGIMPEDLYAVEVVGGATRIPMVRTIIKDTLGRDLSTTLNCDEAVARGCALMAAMASPNFHVREFKVQDSITYGIDLSWQRVDSEEDSNEQLFPQHAPSHLAKMLSFYRDADFELSAAYRDPATVVGKQEAIGRFKVVGVRPNAEGKSQKVKVKVRLNEHGCFEVYSASMVEKVAVVDALEAKLDAALVPEAEGMDTTPDSGAAATTAADGEAGPSPTEESAAAPATPEDAAASATPDKIAAEKVGGKTKTTLTTTPLTVVAEKEYLLSEKALNELVEVELAMQSKDRVEKEKADAKNALEEYIYDIREKIGGALEEFIKPSDLDAFRASLTETEDWLYDEGEDQPKGVYLDRLAVLKTTGNAVKSRSVEYATRPAAIASLRNLIVKFRKVLDLHATPEDDTYSHLDAEDVAKIAKAVEEKEEWVNAREREQAAKLKYEELAVTTAQVQAAAAELTRVCDPIVNKPKPKPPPPPAAEDPPKEDAEAPTAEGQPPAGEDATPATAEPTTASAVDMELD